MGLGPTKDISPFRILMSCGISSKEDFLRNLPKGMFRFSSGKRFPDASVSPVMLRNFMMLKILPSFPSLFWIKKGGALKKQGTNRINNKNTGLNTISPANEIKTSKILFIPF